MAVENYPALSDFKPPLDVFLLLLIDILKGYSDLGISNEQGIDKHVKFLSEWLIQNKLNHKTKITGKRIG